MEQRWHRPSLVGPIILVLIGLVLLLFNLGYVQVDWWQLWRFWPVLLILAGLDVLARHSRWGSAVVALLALGLVAGVVYLVAVNPAPLGWPESVKTFSFDGAALEASGGARQVDLVVRMGVGELRLEALRDSPRLYEVRAEVPERWGTEPHVRYTVDGERGRLLLEGRNRAGWIMPFQGGSRGERWTVGLSPLLPLNIDVDAGASRSVLDLTNLKLGELRVRGGVGSMEARFPAEGERMTARVKGGVGQLVLYVPESLAARIVVEGGLGARQMGERFVRVDERTYETAGYGKAANRLEVLIDGGVGTIRVE